MSGSEFIFVVVGCYGVFFWKKWVMVDRSWSLWKFFSYWWVLVHSCGILLDGSRW